MELRRGGGAVVLLQQALHTQVEVGGLLLPGPAPPCSPHPQLWFSFSVSSDRASPSPWPGSSGCRGPVEVGTVAAVARRKI